MLCCNLKPNERRLIAFVFRPVSKRNLCWLFLLVLVSCLLLTFTSISNVSLKEIILNSRRNEISKGNYERPAINLNTRVHYSEHLNGGTAQENINSIGIDFQNNKGAGHADGLQFNSFFENPDEDENIEVNVPHDTNTLLHQNAIKNYAHNQILSNSSLLDKNRTRNNAVDARENTKKLLENLSFRNEPFLSYKDVRLQMQQQVRHENNHQKIKETVARITGYLHQVSSSAFFNLMEPMRPAQTKGVVIFTNYRSGSTFLGELFNQHPDAFYIFEPLHPFMGNCFDKRQLKIQHLHRQLKCDFPFMPDIYENLGTADQLTNVDIQCLYNNFCFRFKTRELCHRSMCFAPTNICRRCGPIPQNRAMHLCRGKKMSVAKIIRMCDIKDMEDIVNDVDMDIKIIHLVRDPRGIQSSRLKINKKWGIYADAKTTCDRLLSNAMRGSEYLDETSWLTNRYLRVRYEDLALDPLGVASKIYDFVGLSMVPTIEGWIKQNTQVSASDGQRRPNPYSTRRDSREAMQAWRKHLTFGQVEYIQSVCSKAMLYFGYKNATSHQELLDFNISLLR